MAEYTKEQQKAIDLRNRSILVSASAGTGKTAVLTERILTLILDREDPVNIDEMAVVTFTDAAASEMKERIESKLNEKLAAKEDNSAIRKQIALLPHAQITTLHSLCLSIIRNYFYTIGLDPSFRIGDVQEMKIMMNDVLKEVLEEKYREKTPEFIHMADVLTPGKKDDAMDKAVLDMYRNAESHAYPYEWLKKCKALYETGNAGNIDGAEWFAGSGLLMHTELVLNGAKKLLCEAIDMSRKDTAFDKLVVFLSDEAAKVDEVLRCGTYSEYSSRLREFKFERFPTISDTNKKDEKDRIKSLRDMAKKGISDLIKNYYYKDLEEMFSDIAECKGFVDELADTAAVFRKRFLEKKRENNVIDFNDIEHYALEILVNEDSTAADELREQYRYILVDECQDINEVQETIISEISREKNNEPNLFMVGDVKQSIYRFRLADPEIFENKRKMYTDEESLHQRIMLKRNFRSSKGILETANFIFSRLMKRELGNVEYDMTHEFEYDVPDTLSGYGEDTEVIYISEEGIKDTEYDRIRLEAMCIAKKIKEITDPQTGVMITDSVTGEKRTAGYDDIVILLRSMKGWSEEFVEVLMEYQIPVSADENTGYFSAREVQLTLSMLKIIDNPHQDIALVSVLRSVFAGFCDDELARIRAGRDKCDMYDALRYAAENADDDKLRTKCGDFNSMLNGLRAAAPYVRVYELIGKIYEINRFFLNMEVMPQGERRAGNLRMLMEKAIVFEGTDKRSLFDFLEYIEKMKTAKIDFGETEADMSEKGAVKIMSIHRSKGLEFPVVFVSGMGKRPNLTDVNQNVVIHSDIGCGIDYFDTKRRLKRKTIIKKAISRRIIDDSIGEELRILYVAFTRAREKLILTGTVPDIEDLFKKSSYKRYSYSNMVDGRTPYYTWLTPCFMEHPDWNYEYGTDCRCLRYAPMKFNIYRLSDNEREETVHIFENKVIREKLINAAYGDQENNEIARYIEQKAQYEYPYRQDINLASKVSVSEIKRKMAEAIDEDSVNASWAQTEKAEYIPHFAGGEDAGNISGAGRGTMYHNLMEHIKLDEIHGVPDVLELMNRLIVKGVLPENVISGHIISAKKIFAFCESPLAKRMKEAQQKGVCHVEQPFVMGVCAKEIYTGTDSDETILVQGIIDAFFEEEDGIVLVDYKTDRLEPGEENRLADRYRAQMDCYRQAIEKVMDKKVKEVYLYSFSLDKEIRI